MSTWKKIANANHEGEASVTSRHVSKHGLGAGARIKRVRNRAAKKADARWHVASQEA
jgi:hypothetical protein